MQLRSTQQWSGIIITDHSDLNQKLKKQPSYTRSGRSLNVKDSAEARSLSATAKIQEIMFRCYYEKCNSILKKEVNLEMHINKIHLNKTCTIHIVCKNCKKNFGRESGNAKNKLAPWNNDVSGIAWIKKSFYKFKIECFKIHLNLFV